MYTLLEFFPIFMVEKSDFLKVVKIPCSKNRILVILRSFFSTFKFFPGRWWLFPVSKLKREYFKEKTSSLAGLEKSYSIFCKSTNFGHFRLPDTTSKSISSTYRQNFRKSLVYFLGEVVWNIVLIFEFSISAGLRRG